MRGGALQAVAILPELGPRAFDLGDAIEQDRRCTLDGHIDQPATPVLAAPAFGNARGFALVLAAHSVTPGLGSLLAAARKRRGRVSALDLADAQQTEEPDQAKHAPRESAMRLHRHRRARIGGCGDVRRKSRVLLAGRYRRSGWVCRRGRGSSGIRLGFIGGGGVGGGGRIVLGNRGGCNEQRASENQSV